MKKTHTWVIIIYLLCANLFNANDKSIDNKIFSLKFPSDMMRKKQEGKYTYMMHYPMNFLCAYCVTKNLNNEIMKI